jgi:hypothetical protein
MSERNVNVDDCLEMMKSRSARNFLYQHLKDIGTFVDNFNPDPYIHCRYAGQRAAGIMLQEKLKQCAPEQYKQMIREQHDY